MSREEDAVRATTRAIAATVRDVPPLELEPAPGELWSPGRAPRRGRHVRRGPRLRSWLAPVAAAAVVVAVAVSLVLVRGSQNESVVPQPTSTVAGPGGVPRYYVALHPVTGKPGAADGLQVGDTITGKTLAVITPPAHMSYQSVTAAADDRTFLAFATATATATGTEPDGTDGSWFTGRWYELRLTPGTAHLVSLTTTAIGTQSGVEGSALSGSGRYLAMAQTGPAKGQRRVVIFSVATGRPMRAWSTLNPFAWTLGSFQQNVLTWIDGDRAIAFSAVDTKTGTDTVRRLNAGGPPGDGDLIGDSQVIWSTPASTSSGLSCKFATPLVSADGRTIACATFGQSPAAGHRQWTVTWHAYRASAQAPAAGQGTIAYQATGQLAQGGSTAMYNTLWVSPSGSALIGEWAVIPAATVTPGTSGATSVALADDAFNAALRVGVLSHGTFRPLRLPLDIPRQSASSIAW